MSVILLISKIICGTFITICRIGITCPFFAFGSIVYSFSPFPLPVIIHRRTTISTVNLSGQNIRLAHRICFSYILS